MSRLSSFLRRHGYLGPAPPPEAIVGRYLTAPPLDVEVDVDPAILSTLLDRVTSAWTELGSTDPYWSVLVNPIYRLGKIEQTKSRFFATAEWDVAVIESCLARAGQGLRSDGTCLELGCGVGRVTARLAQMFDRVIAVDVSRPHIELATERMRMLRLSNVEFVRLERAGDFRDLPRHDFFYSRIVLQHNPPPVMAHILRSVLAKLSPGGLCLFQVPTYCDQYRFVVADYLATRPGGMEMHVLPQPVVHSILREGSVDLLEAVEDQSTENGAFQSVTFFGRKSDGGPSFRGSAARDFSVASN